MNRLMGIGSAMAALFFATAQGGAQTQPTAQAGGDFTFKRVAPPNSGTSKRITVQIDPSEDIFRITPGAAPRRPGDPGLSEQLAPVAPPSTPPSSYAWYWEAVTPSVGVDPATRVGLAIDTVRKNGDRIGTPRLQTLQGIADAHGVDILSATIGTQVSPALVLAVIAVESAGQVKAESHAGAQGLMQLMPATAERFGVTDSFNASLNIKGGVTYLDWLLDRFDNDAVLALSGYNAGEGAVDKHNGVPPFNETRAYVPKVLAAWNLARGLCLTPPQLISDGCVFVRRSAASE